MSTVSDRAGRPRRWDTTHDEPSRVPSRVDAQRRAESVKLRRGLTFLAMTLVLPGSAQLAAGHRRLGRTALRIWAGLVGLVVVLVVVGLASHSAAVTIASNPLTLRVLQVLLVLLAIGWGALFIDAWRLSRPPELRKQHRLGFAILNLALVFVVSGGLLASASVVSAQHDLITSIFAGGGDTAVKDGRYNILLLGGDAGKTRVGLRPDSITVASIDAKTGRTVLLSLPRNMEDVPFPASSPMHKEFPNGFGCPDHTCMLNAVYTYATEHKDLYPGVKDPGIQATKEAVQGALGIPINYYALVDLKGFTQLVDAVGGVTIDVNQRIPIGGGGRPVYDYIEPGKNQHLDGFHTLWFARSRHADSDYARMARQKCVMTAMLNQLDPVTVLTKFNKIAAAGKQIMETDVPPSETATLVNLALKAKQKPISSIAFVPPLVYPGSPKFDVVHAETAKKIAASEAKDEKKSKAAGSPTATRPTTEATTDATTGPSGAGSADASSAGNAGSSASAQPGQDTSDLAEVCAAS